MFGIGFAEIIAVAVIALIFIGPEDLPKFARTLGRLLNEIKRGSDHFVNEIKNAGPADEFRKLESDLHHTLHQEPAPIQVEELKKDEPS